MAVSSRRGIPVPAQFRKEIAVFLKQQRGQFAPNASPWAGTLGRVIRAVTEGLP